MRARRVSFAAGLALLMAPGGASAGPLKCPGWEISVIGGSLALRQRVCGIVVREAPRLAACNVAVPAGTELRITADLPANCYGVFHCGKGAIDVLPPAAMAEARQPDPAFAMVPDDAFFDSIVVHELTHAAYDKVPCPFQACTATAEYAAYAMQVRALPPPVRRAFGRAADNGRRISRGELSALYHAAAPGRFAQKAWRHFTQQQDGCKLIGQIMSGAVLFDRERF